MRINSIQTVFLVCCVMLFILSCGRKSSEVHGIIDLQAVSENPVDLNLSDIGEDFELIPLETVDHALLTDSRKIEKVVYHNNEYFVASGSVIYRFSKDGSFLNTIGNVGRGPGEHTYLRDFDVDSNGKSVVILAARKVFVFRSDGKFVHSFDAESNSVNVAAIDGMIVTYSDNTTESAEHSFCFYDMKGNKTKWLPSYYGYEGEITTVMVFFNKPFYKRRGNLYAKEFHSDTVFLISGTKPEPHIILSSGTGRYTPAARTLAISPRDYVLVDQLFETGNYLIVRFSYKGSLIMLFHNKETLENAAINARNGIFDDVITKNPVRMFHYSESGNWLLYLINATDYSKYREKTGGPEIDESGNPVIVRFRLKDRLLR